MWCTDNLCICTKSNTPCGHWIIVLEQMSTAAPRDGSSFFLEGVRLWCMCTYFRLYLLPSWSLLPGFGYTIRAPLLQSPCFWRPQESLPFGWTQPHEWGAACALVAGCAKGPVAFSWRSSLKHAPPVEQPSSHGWKRFADVALDPSFETVEARHLHFKSDYAC